MGSLGRRRLSRRKEVVQSESHESLFWILTTDLTIAVFLFFCIFVTILYKEIHQFTHFTLWMSRTAQNINELAYHTALSQTLTVCDENELLRGIINSLAEKNRVISYRFNEQEEPKPVFINGREAVIHSSMANDYMIFDNLDANKALLVQGKPEKVEEELRTISLTLAMYIIQSAPSLWKCHHVRGYLFAHTPGFCPNPELRGIYFCNSSRSRIMEPSPKIAVIYIDILQAHYNNARRRLDTSYLASFDYKFSRFRLWFGPPLIQMFILFFLSCVLFTFAVVGIHNTFFNV